ncbi:MAG: Tyrosine-tRNA ligase [Candidatus Uhrbacteria bacterium GW2011_GWE2_45_35]|uniref:Tyrosine--tRNA ligase n=1 Tax=Candidatus Uhrbacteria bacterium GW2011_GWE2_45_35 TaxID=1618993 RepID=A0A0G1MG64_9BACT|nr:MAG: Tyrosine-tRNA ligase [Candidatus Uhrbacteria bacterium GW2011_GWE2_45_35]HBR80818.1 tyrosine--tRNA ligase [Candidatus Uhrbacteria bacterium]HCU32149.1 tyrosine--tRNA ligase [Candidatus Uhrbacteria bacterium]
MGKINIDPKAVEDVLTRGVDEVIVVDDLRKRMLSGDVLRIKLGIDPTSPNLHIGRSIPLLKLRDFQELGHQIVFIVGDFTGVIGDTSDKESERPMLVKEKVEENMKNYVAQAGKIIDMEKCEVHYNSEWLGKLGYGEIGVQADQFSLAEFISRENIRRRLDAGTRVSLRELLYPLMQGYDSVAIKADVEVGGTDQRFNLLSGRTMQQFYGQKSQNIITNPLIEGTDGRKMSSSWGNTINLTAEPDDMFGKVMSITDDLIIKYFIFVTRVPMAKISGYEEDLKTGVNPRGIKADLAFEITKMYHSEEAAQKARENFDKQFRDKEIPDEMPELKIGAPINIIDLLVQSQLAPSKGEARRLIDGGGVKVAGQVVENYEFLVEPTVEGVVIQKGKRGFVRVF